MTSEKLSFAVTGRLSSYNVTLMCCLGINFSLLTLFNKWTIYFYNIWVLYICIVFGGKGQYLHISWSSVCPVSLGKTCIKLGIYFGFLLNEFVALKLGEIVEFVFEDSNPRLQEFIVEICGGLFRVFGDWCLTTIEYWFCIVGKTFVYSKTFP